MIITLDGPAGSGKSTISKKLAKLLGFDFLDTGAMYRAVTLFFLNNKIDINKEYSIQQALSKIDIVFKNKDIFLNGINVSDDIRKPDIDANVSAVSALAAVREKLVDLQRCIANSDDYVAEGRDMGSVVFPDAKFKFYLDANIEVRAERRIKQYPRIKQYDRNSDIDLEAIKADIIRRDELDSKREISPLLVPNDAIIIDTSDLSIDEVVEKILGYVEK